MAKLTIVTDQEFLRKKSKLVTEFGARLHQLLDDMHETLKAAKGVGLAAVQVGVLYRVCLVIDQGEVIELINPEIIHQSNPKNGDEGCLSVPKAHAKIMRAHHVTVQAVDRYSKPFTRIFEKISAVCAAHEIDHMNGVLFIDYMEAK